MPTIVRALGRIRLQLSLSTGAGVRPAIADLPPAAPALISFTSGSGGRPKGIVRSHAFLAAQDHAVAPLLRPRPIGEIDLVGFPVFVISNLGQGITSLLPNWPLRAPGRARAAAIRTHCERHHATRLLLSPATAQLLAEDRIPCGVHTLLTGGGPIFPDLIARLRHVAPDLAVITVYGSTEAEPIAELNARDVTEADRTAMRQGAGLLAGEPVSCARVRIVEDEIWVAGPHVVEGYLDSADDATTKVTEDGVVWHRTGDGGRLDAEGRLWLLGRLDAKVGGLWPFEVEAPARLWTGVRRAALTSRSGKPILVLEGDRAQQAHWRNAALAFGLGNVVWIAVMPLDRRHGSKIDHIRLDRCSAVDERNVGRGRTRADVRVQRCETCVSRFGRERTGRFPPASTKKRSLIRRALARSGCLQSFTLASLLV